MSTGRSIRVYLADGSASGIRHGEIVNWTGQAVACPRSRVAELKRWPEVQRPGLYFLFGGDAVYIGEGEVVIERLGRHLNAKEFWSDAVVFTSKDDNLTKVHVKYLESRLIALTLHGGRYTVLNAVTPQLPVLPRPDRAAMDEFIDGVCTLLAVLGQRAPRPMTISPAAAGRHGRGLWRDPAAAPAGDGAARAGDGGRDAGIGSDAGCNFARGRRAQPKPV